MRITMPSRQPSRSHQAFGVLKAGARTGLRWSGQTALSVLLTLSLMTTSGCGESDSGGDEVAQSDTKADAGGGGGMPGGGGPPGGGGGGGCGGGPPGVGPRGGHGGADRRWRHG